MSKIIPVDSAFAQLLARNLRRTPKELFKKFGDEKKQTIDFEKLTAAFPSRFINLGELNGACWDAWAVDNGDGNVGSGRLPNPDLIIEFQYSCNPPKKRDYGIGIAKLFKDHAMQCVGNATFKTATVSQQNRLLADFKKLRGQPWSEAKPDSKVWQAVCNPSSQSAAAGDETGG